jgi:FecR protein
LSPDAAAAAVPEHSWWFSASAAIAPDRHNLFLFSYLKLGHQIALPEAELSGPVKRLLPTFAIVAITIAAFCAASLRAQEDPDGQYEPGRAVARISVLNGDVSVRRGDSGDVVAAALNAPLMADDRLLTSSSGRAEVELDSSNVIRIGPNSEVRFTAMDVKSFQIQVATGTVTFRTLRPGQAQVEVDTPSVAVRPLQPGAYRVTVHDDATSEITVRLGQAEIDSQRGGESLQAGQTMDARGPASDAEFQIVQGIPYDAFDRWNDERDRYIENSQSSRHVSPNISGTEDLDQNGRWVNDPTYGSVWQPTVGPDWAPYQNGRWVWEDYYGWTWVSADPWGWAPYHYGRWFWGPGGWCWYPGPIFANPFWAPAYVGFFGFGGGFGIGVGFGFGGVGWVALAPFEVFHPWWGRGFYGGFRGGFYGNHTTIVNNVNVYNSFRNARVTGGAIGISTGAFGRGGQFTALNRSQLQSAGVVHGVLPVAPDRSSLRFSDRSVSGRFPQARSQSFAGRMQAPRVEHATFDQQQRGMEQMSRTNFSRPGAGASGGLNEAGRGAGNSATHGWSRFGEPIHGTNGAAGAYGRGESQFSRGYQSPSGREGGAIRINPPIVQQRSAQPRGEQQRGYSSPGNYSQPRGSVGGARGGASNAGGRNGGGVGHSGGGGGHHR